MWLKLVGLVSKVSGGQLLYGALALAVFLAGATANGYRWDAKYSKLETDYGDYKLEVTNQRLTEQEQVNKELEDLAALQAQYTKLNEETYNDLRVKLDEVARSVASYGTRVVRVCSDKADARVVASSSVPTAASGAIARSPDDERAGLERDSGQGGNTAGYDIFPETTAIMERADVAAAKCNALVGWAKGVQASITR
jgi:hypothetical protein